MQCGFKTAWQLSLLSKSLFFCTKVAHGGCFSSSAMRRLKLTRATHKCFPVTWGRSRCSMWKACSIAGQLVCTVELMGKLDEKSDVSSCALLECRGSFPRTQSSPLTMPCLVLKCIQPCAAQVQILPLSFHPRVWTECFETSNKTPIYWIKQPLPSTK